MLKEGDKAPQFELSSDEGKVYNLAKLVGKWVVLYFYPKDSTPGCTTEACEFNASLEDFDDSDAVILGVSKDSLASHTRFRSKYELQFPLLSDEDLSVHKKYGAYGEKNNYGKKTVGAIRSTFLIDKNQNIAKVWRNVRVKGHVANVMEELSQMSSKSAGMRSKSIRLDKK